ncbi:MAG TPA: hypothetical protein VJ831_08180 [Jatrophihabitantaceae bacterium]|nr:hypothetical protein [Jatrophihabitantaceae bacterium]
MSATGCHVQLFASTPAAALRWRLLSGNNREIGRGAEFFPDAESCRIAVKDLQTALDDLVPAVRRESGHAWVWQLSFGDRVVATSAHGYDRLIRCERGMSQFRVEMRTARVGDVVMISQTRRWGGSYA